MTVFDLQSYLTDLISEGKGEAEIVVQRDGYLRFADATDLQEGLLGFRPDQGPFVVIE